MERNNHSQHERSLIYANYKYESKPHARLLPLNRVFLSDIFFLVKIWSLASLTSFFAFVLQKILQIKKLPGYHNNL